MSKPSLPQGTRDFGPDTVRKRNYIFNTIKHVFELYGFQPLETPAMENMETLMGKYGEEGDKLIFKILNNGLNDPKNIDKAKTAFDNVLQGKNDKNLTERALKYDLTIPFARYVAMNHNQLTFPFKRYQIQPVWRADRPQKGRYREFYQCDADVAGSTSIITEIELLRIYDDVFTTLKIPDIEIKINSRTILKALAHLLGDETRLVTVANIIDNIDKIGKGEVKTELYSLVGNNKIYTQVIDTYLNINGTNTEKIQQLINLYDPLNTDPQTFGRIKSLIEHFDDNPPTNQIAIDLTLARGLTYYTGLIVEVKCNAVKIGSIGGGGAYHDLTALFGVPNIPGVGISFGVDRIYDVMEELRLFPEEVHTGTQVLFFNLGEAESKKAFELMQQLRNNNIRCELYHETSKFDKQFRYAEKKNIPYIIIIGSKELEEKNCVIKNLRTSKQQTISIDDLLKFSFT